VNALPATDGAAASRRIGTAAVPAIGQGTWKIEGDRVSAVTALRRGIDLGLTHIDTAEMYGDGQSERVVGEAIRQRRDGIFLVSKVLPSHAGYEATLQACERTLRNLGTDHLDLYLLHWRGGIPLAETFRAFERLVAHGKIKAFGVSNFDVADLEAAFRLEPGRRLVCNQVLYHLQERTVEAAIEPWCREHGVAVVAYSPFGQDAFPAEKSAGGKVLAEVGARHGKTARQVALAFLVRESNVLAIPKSGQVAHVEENAGALGFPLAPADMAKIDAAFPLRAKKHLPML
jgi:diketogulonate reductase-like aldo/keto reductase